MPLETLTKAEKEEQDASLQAAIDRLKKWAQREGEAETYESPEIMTFRCDDPEQFHALRIGAELFGIERVIPYVGPSSKCI